MWEGYIQRRISESSTGSPGSVVPAIPIMRVFGLHVDNARHFCHSQAVLLCSAVDPIDEAWARVETDWGDEEAHRRFVGVCVALERLPEAGKRYRHVRETDASRSEDAARQIDRLIVLATQQLEDTKVVRGTTEHKRTLTWAAFFIMLMLMGAGAWLLLRA